jgi:hypothetical protein
VSDAAGDRYELLVELILRELELAGAGELDALAVAHAQRVQLAATLPECPPPCARAALQRAELLQRSLHMELERGREALVLGLAELRQAQRAAEGYEPPRRRVLDVAG